MKKHMPEIVGNERLRRRLCEDIREGTLSHAYILEGPNGSGKHLIARQLAAALACEKRTDPLSPLPCGQCPACRKILGGLSPDVITFGREDKATIGVDTVRALRENAYSYPNDLDFKLYVIEDAHTLTTQAQNAFLLTLEEPPSFVRFLLLCENTQSILETIKSRAPILRTEPIPCETMASHLCRTDPQALAFRDSAPSQWQEILLAADGCIGRVKQLLDPKTRKPILARREDVRQFIHACIDHRERGTRLIALGTAQGNKRDDVCAFLLTLETALRDLMLLKKEENAPLLFFPDREEAIAISDRIGAAMLWRLYETCEEARVAIDIRNANIRLTYLDFLLKAGLLRT
ncbi:MAG: hypothetical protein IJW99_01865 [Clostridia bacterium]|nr:hypothetical protein [Clostridia bacterium]